MYWCNCSKVQATVSQYFFRLCCRGLWKLKSVSAHFVFKFPQYFRKLSRCFVPGQNLCEFIHFFSAVIVYIDSVCVCSEYIMFCLLNSKQSCLWITKDIQGPELKTMCKWLLLQIFYSLLSFWKWKEFESVKKSCMKKSVFNSSLLKEVKRKCQFDLRHENHARWRHENHARCMFPRNPCKQDQF